MAERPRAWQLLLRLLPGWYAERFGHDLWQTHADAHSARGRGVSFWLRLTWDVVLTALQLRAEAVLGRRGMARTRVHASRVDILLQQGMHAMRNLVRAPGFTLTVVCTLGLGIGATVTLFTVLDRLLLSAPEHVVSPEDVQRVHVHGRHPFVQEIQYSAALTYPDYVDLERVGGFDAIAGYTTMELAIDVGEGSARIHAELATPTYFTLLGVTPHAGRFFAAEEDRVASGSSVVVLSYGFWQRVFGGDRGVIGRQLRIGKGMYEVVGIAPRGFTGVDIAPVDVWLPLRTAAANQWGTSWGDARRWWWLAAVVRAPHARVAVVSAEATRAYAAGRASVTGQDPNARIVLSPLIGARGPLASRESKVARLLAGLALLVLLIACANVANLLLARGVRRRRLLAIQTAIGITRGRLLGQMIMEALLIAIAAGALALSFTSLLAPALYRVLLPDAMLATSAATRALLFTAAVTLCVTVLVGVLPALRSTRFDLMDALRFTRESRRGSAIRRSLLFIQATLATVLVVGAGLFVRSLASASAVDMGIDTNALAIEFELDDGSRGGDEVVDVSYRALERIRALPFVTHAAVTQLPQFQGYNGITVLVGRDTIAEDGRPPYFYTGTGGYFAALGLRIVRGRALEDADDRAGAEPVAVISESVVRAMLRDRDALGTCVHVEPGRTNAPCTRIVGIVEDARSSIRAAKPDLNIYLPPHHPGLGEISAGVVIARTDDAAADQLDAIRAAAAAASGRIRLVEVNRLSSFLESELRPWRMGAVLLTAFGVLALLVAGAGLFSVLSFDVAQRHFELSVRAALGASATRLVRAVVARTLVICGLGVLAGGAVTVLAGRRAGELLFVSPYEPRVLATSLTLLMLFAAVSAAMPAWRALRADPKSALSGD